MIKVARLRTDNFFCWYQYRDWGCKTVAPGFEQVYSYTVTSLRAYYSFPKMTTIIIVAKRQPFAHNIWDKVNQIHSFIFLEFLDFEPLIRVSFQDVRNFFFYQWILTIPRCAKLLFLIEEFEPLKSSFSWRTKSVLLPVNFDHSKMYETFASPREVWASYKSLFHDVRNLFFYQWTLTIPRCMKLLILPEEFEPLTRAAFHGVRNLFFYQ